MIIGYMGMCRLCSSRSVCLSVQFDLSGAALFNNQSMSPFQLIFQIINRGIALNCMSFFIGLKFSKRIDKIWPFIQNPDWLRKGRDFFKTYGVFGIILAKFIGPIRPLMPLTAGSLNMKFRSFLPVELFASLIWTPLYSLPGYFAGKAVFADINNFFLLLSILIAVVFTILLYMKLIKKSY